MEGRKSYPAKVMLAGEYGVLLGGSALTIPLHRFTARVRELSDIPSGRKDEVTRSMAYLKALSDYIHGLPEKTFHVPPDLSLLEEQVEMVWMEMDIPTGAGLGSSGAVSAALYDRYFPGSGQLPLHHQKQDLAAIESYFHGKSSGVDALTCYTGCPLYFSMDGSVRKVDFDPTDIPGGYRFFLVDSGNRIQSGPLVKHFLQQVQDPGFEASIRNEYLFIIQKLIESLLGEGDADPGMLFGLLSDYQYKHFRRMIPPDLRDAWIHGQVSGEYSLKLNGSGGGFMLGFTHRSYMDSLEARWKEQLIWIG